MSFFDIFRTKKLKDEISLLQNQKSALESQVSTLQSQKSALENQMPPLQSRISALENTNHELTETLKSLGANDYFTVKKNTEQLQASYDEIRQSYNALSNDVSEIAEKKQKLEKQVASNQKKLGRIKELYKSAENAVNNYSNLQFSYEDCKIPQTEYKEMDLLSPSITTKLHCMDVKDLRKAYRDNEKQITALLEKYSSRYTTKANKTIYNLMVIALKAEIQNILYNLKYEKLDVSIETVRDISQKYMKLACEGNQSIAGTLTKFIGEIEYLFTNAVKIEYNYYVKKEQARQEQLALKEKMRQEAAERKELEAERKKVEQEENKYKNEIQKLKEQLESAAQEELDTLNRRILELQSQLSDVIVKKRRHCQPAKWFSRHCVHYQQFRLIWQRCI